MSTHAAPRHLTQGLLVNEGGAADADSSLNYADVARRKADSDGLIDTTHGTADDSAAAATGDCPSWCPSCCHNKLCSKLAMFPRVWRFMPALSITINSSIQIDQCPALPGLSALLLAWGCVLLLISTLK